MEPNGNPDEKQDLFNDDQQRLVKASHGKRFINYLVDIIAFEIICAIILSVGSNFYPPLQNWLLKTVEVGRFTLIEQLLIIVCYGTYMFIIEAVFKGKTLGKMITGTRAVRRDGSTINVRDAQLRGLCRMIPFHPLSALTMPCYPWHDRWTRTLVIDEKASYFRVPS